MRRVVVRVASAADLLELPAVEEAADELFRGRGVLDLPAAAPAVLRARAWRVLVVGRPVVGVAVLERVDGDVHLEQLSVHPSAMRRGVGAALLSASVDQARWAGARSPRSATGTSFPPRSREGPRRSGDLIVARPPRRPTVREDALR